MQKVSELILFIAIDGIISLIGTKDNSNLLKNVSEPDNAKHKCKHSDS